jgi:hypothetical protein
MTSNLQASQQPGKFNVNNAGQAAASGDNKRVNQNKPMFSRNNNAIMTSASTSQKIVTTTGTCCYRMILGGS